MHGGNRYGGTYFFVYTNPIKVTWKHCIHIFDMRVFGYWGREYATCLGAILKHFVVVLLLECFFVSLFCFSSPPYFLYSSHNFPETS